MSHSFATIASIPTSPISFDISKCTLSQPDLHTQQAEENPRQTSAASIPKQNLPGNCWIRKSKKKTSTAPVSALRNIPPWDALTEGKENLRSRCLACRTWDWFIFATKNRRTSSNYRGTHRNLEPLLVCLPNQVANMVAVTCYLQFASLGLILTFNTSEDTTVALGMAPRISTIYLISSSVRFAALGRFALKNAVTNGSPVSESHT